MCGFFFSFETFAQVFVLLLLFLTAFWIQMILALLRFFTKYFWCMQPFEIQTITRNFSQIVFSFGEAVCRVLTKLYCIQCYFTKEEISPLPVVTGNLQQSRFSVQIKSAQRQKSRTIYGLEDLRECPKFFCCFKNYSF